MSPARRYSLRKLFDPSSASSFGPKKKSASMLKKM